MARGGARPGAGAKPLHEQVCRMQDLNRCWDVVMEYINSDAPLDKRADLASKLAIKSVPQDINLGGQDGNPLAPPIINYFFGSNSEKS